MEKGQSMPEKGSGHVQYNNTAMASVAGVLCGEKAVHAHCTLKTQGSLPCALHMRLVMIMTNTTNIKIQACRNSSASPLCLLHILPALTAADHGSEDWLSQCDPYHTGWHTTIHGG